MVRIIIENSTKTESETQTRYYTHGPRESITSIRERAKELANDVPLVRGKIVATGWKADQPHRPGDLIRLRPEVSLAIRCPMCMRVHLHPWCLKRSDKEMDLYVQSLCRTPYPRILYTIAPYVVGSGLSGFHEFLPGREVAIEGYAYTEPGDEEHIGIINGMERGVLGF